MNEQDIDDVISNAIARMDREHRKRCQALIVAVAAVVIATIVLAGFPVVLVLVDRTDLFLPIFGGWCCAVSGLSWGFWYAARRWGEANPVRSAEQRAGAPAGLD